MFNASFYVCDKSNSLSEKNENSNKHDLNKLNEFVLKKMMDFDLKFKVLTIGESVKFTLS